MAEQKKYQCIGECGKEFKHGEWECFPGVKHLVESKTYFINDAPHCDFTRDPDGMAFRSSKATVYVIPAKTTTDIQGKLVTEPARAVDFVKGQYATRDAEEQFFIERAKIDCGYDRWFEAYHTPTQKQRIRGNDIGLREAKLKAAEAQDNQLLERIKARQEELAALEKKVEEKQAARAGR